MNKIINKFLLTEDNLSQNHIYNSQDLLIVLVDYSLNIVKEFKNLETQVF